MSDEQNEAATAPDSDAERPEAQSCILGHAEPVEAFEGFVCRRHFHWLADTLRQIEELFALRGVVLLPGPSTETRHGSRDGSPAPGRVAIMALTDKRAKDWHDDDEAIPDLPGALYSWIRLMGEEREDDDIADINGDVSTLVGVLHRERHWIVRQVWVDDYAADLAALHRFVASAVGDSMWPKPVGRCPNDGAALFNTIGADEITCRRCKFTWSGIALVRLRLIHEQDRAKEA